MLKVKDSHKTLGKGESYDNYYDNTTWQHLFIVIISTAFITAIGVLLYGTDVLERKRIFQAILKRD